MVLAHELAHHVHRDIWTGIVVEMLLMLAGFFVAHLVLGRRGRSSVCRGWPIPPVCRCCCSPRAPSRSLLLPAVLALSRGHERRADRFALDLTRNPAAFSSAMKRLGAQNLAEDARRASCSGSSTATRRCRAARGRSRLGDADRGRGTAGRTGWRSGSQE